MNRDAPLHLASSADRAGTARLRILATSDLHASILPFDYGSGRSVEGFGLARTASLIAEARQDAAACLLVDNGDFLQGTPLGEPGIAPAQGAVHPVIAAMNALGYDAVGLGNHEFNFGLATLQAVLSGVACPVICANALTRRGATVAEDETLVAPSVILTRQVTTGDGTRHPLRIALLGLVPPQITAWDRFHLDGRITARDMVETAAARVPLLRRQGADLVILLAHTAPAPEPPRAGMENAALALAQLPGVDAIIAGHDHQVFPRPGVSGAAGIDHAAGTFHGVPAVMPGYRGSHLGVIDLDLARRQDGWHVVAHRSESRPVHPAGGQPPAPAAPAITAAVQHSHDAALRRLSAPLAHTRRPIHSYLSRIRGDLPVRLVGEAMRLALKAMLAGGAFADLPVLAAAAPYHTGGRAGPEAFTDIPAGPLTLRHVANLCPFPNTLCAVWLTGAEIRDWLECAASGFCRIRPGQPDQRLCDPAFAGHDVDTIVGLSYRINLAEPAGFDARGSVRTPAAGRSKGRIEALAHDGRPLDPKARFVIALTNYRAFGGGPYPALPPERLVQASRVRVRDAVADFLRASGHETLAAEPVWSLSPVSGASAVIETGPGLDSYPDDIAALGLEDLGHTEGRFLRLRLPLAPVACESRA